MQAIAEIQVIPLGVGTSVRTWVKRAHEMIVESGLEVELHAMGTNVEGDLAAILDVVRRLHETLHADGVPRISTAIKLGTRTDKAPSLAAKRL